jgi:hypothetical protein
MPGVPANAFSDLKAKFKSLIKKKDKKPAEDKKTEDVKPTETNGAAPTETAPAEPAAAPARKSSRMTPNAYLTLMTPNQPKRLLSQHLLLNLLLSPPRLRPLVCIS